MSLTVPAARSDSTAVDTWVVDTLPLVARPHQAVGMRLAVGTRLAVVPPAARADTLQDMRPAVELVAGLAVLAPELVQAPPQAAAHTDAHTPAALVGVAEHTLEERAAARKAAAVHTPVAGQHYGAICATGPPRNRGRTSSRDPVCI